MVSPAAWLGLVWVWVRLGRVRVSPAPWLVLVWVRVRDHSVPWWVLGLALLLSYS